MFFSTVGEVSANTEIVETLGVIQYRTQEDLHEKKKGLIASLMPTEPEECPITTAYDYLERRCRRWGGNAVIGITITTTTASFSNGTFLYTTYIGTAVKIKEIKSL